MAKQTSSARIYSSKTQNQPKTVSPHSLKSSLVPKTGETKKFPSNGYSGLYKKTSDEMKMSDIRNAKKNLIVTSYRKSSDKSNGGVKVINSKPKASSQVKYSDINKYKTNGSPQASKNTFAGVTFAGVRQLQSKGAKTIQIKKLEGRLKSLPSKSNIKTVTNAKPAKKQKPNDMVLTTERSKIANKKITENKLEQSNKFRTDTLKLRTDPSKVMPKVANTDITKTKKVRFSEARLTTINKKTDHVNSKKLTDSQPNQNRRKQGPALIPVPAPVSLPVITPFKPEQSVNSFKSMSKQSPPFSKVAVSDPILSTSEKFKKKTTHGSLQVQKQ